MLALQADGASVETVESLCVDDRLGPLQEAMADNHAFQCAFCASGFLMTAHCLLAEGRQLTREEIREELSGNLCRCTGYQSIVDGVEAAIAALQGGNGA
jgi:carbon-monoxide dehydrogenase small subunit